MGSKMITKQLMQEILNGDFANASQLVADLNLEGLEGLLMEIAYDTESDAVYKFVCYLIAQKESAALHTIASLIMSNPLCFLPDGYARGLYHAKRAMELDPANVSLMELMLFYNTIPDKLVTKDEALEYAKQILLIEPNNKAALNFINI
jgi:hypothetical protein